MERENSQAVERIFKIIEAVAEVKDGLGISDIARAVSLPKSTVYRIASSLVMNSYLMKDSLSDKYSLGYRFIAVAGDYVDRLDIRSVAAPYIHTLSNSLNVTSHIAIRQEDMAIYIEKFQPYTHTCTYSEIGRAIELYCSGLGKSLLLGLNEEELKDYYRRIKTTKYTDNTLTVDELERELIIARDSHITIDNAEHETGTYCLATPIFNYNNEILAAISISSSDQSILTNTKFRKDILSTGQKISKLFGYMNLIR